MTTSKYIRISAIFTFILIISSAVTNAQKIEDNEIKKNVSAIDNSLQRLVQLEPKIFE
ncbi:MAG: hypothetical protein JNL23_11285, partial [Chitinophagaceae bacterium]|nr:hypothetical protein [Chitinophagaceae bacterium]